MSSKELSGRPLRSQPTRDRILAAAKRLFARDGYDGATIRAIGSEAGINPAMVMRYFGNKEQLFAAVTTLKFSDAGLSAVPKSRIGEALIRIAMDRWDDPAIGPTMLAILRTSMTNTAARAQFIEQYTVELAKLIHRVSNVDVSKYAAPLIASQALGVLLTRYLLRIPSVVAMPREVLIRETGRAMQSCLHLG